MPLKVEKVTLRAIGPDDERFLSRLYAGTRDDILQLDWNDAQKETFLESQFQAQHKYYKEQFPTADFKIMMQGRKRIGRLYIDRRLDEIRIIDIALLPQYRGKGIGSSFMKAIIAEAEKAGLPLRIHVAQFNPALRLYKRLGFKKIGDTGVYFIMERLAAHDHAGAK